MLLRPGLSAGIERRTSSEADYQDMTRNTAQPADLYGARKLVCKPNFRCLETFGYALRVPRESFTLLRGVII